MKHSLFNFYELNSFKCFESFISLPFSADMKPSHLMSEMLHLLPEDNKTDFLFVNIFNTISLLKFVPVYSERISKIPEPWLGKLMSSGNTVTWVPSTRYLMHLRTRMLKMFLLSPPALLPVLLPVLLPLQSLEDQPHQGLHPHQDLVLHGGASTTGIMGKKLSAARAPVLCSGKLAGWREEQAWEFFSQYRSFNIYITSVKLYLFWGSSQFCQFLIVSGREDWKTGFRRGFPGYFINGISTLLFNIFLCSSEVRSQTGQKVVG